MEVLDRLVNDKNQAPQLLSVKTLLLFPLKGMACANSSYLIECL